MAIGKNSLRSSSLLGDAGDGDDPRTGLVNLADVMLVFACGLIVALITHYNVDLVPQDSAASVDDSIQKLEQELTSAEQGVASSDAMFSEVGIVYQDVETGDLYVVSSDDSVGGDNAADGAAADSAGSGGE